MLHLVNGEATASALASAGLVGEVRSGDDVLMEGPVPNGLATAGDWQARAAVLEARFGIPSAGYLEHAESRERVLASAPSAGGLTLWFEEDLFCQINFLYLCSRLSSAMGVWLVCPPRVRLGRLSPEALFDQHEGRQPVTEVRLAAARVVWQAYCAADPRDLAASGAAAAGAWPGLDRWVALHLARFPSVQHGLNVIEEAIVRQAVRREHGFADFFRALQADNSVVDYGLGDLQVARLLLDLALAAEPAVEIAGWDGNPLWASSSRSATWRIRPTAAAEGYLVGRDYVERNGIDRYLGGVHVTGHTPHWRWDSRVARLVAS